MWPYQYIPGGYQIDILIQLNIFSLSFILHHPDIVSKWFRWTVCMYTVQFPHQQAALCTWLSLPQLTDRLIIHGAMSDCPEWQLACCCPVAANAQSWAFAGLRFLDWYKKVTSMPKWLKTYSTSGPGLLKLLAPLKSKWLNRKWGKRHFHYTKSWKTATLAQLATIFMVHIAPDSKVPSMCIGCRLKTHKIPPNFPRLRTVSELLLSHPPSLFWPWFRLWMTHTHTDRQRSVGQTARPLHNTLHTLWPSWSAP